jgi:hypothetical protein
MLRHLATLHRESQPNGRLESIKWFVKSAAAKDFLLPAMLIALDLHFDNAGQGPSGGRRDSDYTPFWSREKRQEMICSLELTRDVWKGLTDSSVEALKAYNIINVMLTKIKSSGDPDGPETSVMFGGRDSMGTQPAQSAGMALGMLSSGGMMAEPSTTFSGVQTSVSPRYAAAVNLNYGAALAGMGPSPGSSTTTAMGGGVTASEFPNPMLGFDGGQSPLSMFDSMASSAVDYSSNFDWVRDLCRQALAAFIDHQLTRCDAGVV